MSLAILRVMSVFNLNFITIVGYYKVSEKGVMVYIRNLNIEIHF